MSEQRIKIVIHGFGNMGRIIYALSDKHNIRVVGIIDDAHDLLTEKDATVQDLSIRYEDLENLDYDILVDFSHFSRINDLLDVLEKNPHKAVIATTKLNDDHLARIQALSEQVAIYQDYNTSYGVFVLNETLKFMTGLLDDYDVELLETHHKYKVDAPSGTAKRLVDTISSQRDVVEVTDYSTKTKAKNNNEIGIHSIRTGSVVGNHEIIFGTDYEVITLKHHALSKNLFAEGTLKICKQLQHKDTGLYKLEEVFKN